MDSLYRGILLKVNFGQCVKCKNFVEVLHNAKPIGFGGSMDGGPINSEPCPHCGQMTMCIGGDALVRSEYVFPPVHVSGPPSALSSFDKYVPSPAPTPAHTFVPASVPSPTPFRYPSMPSQYPSMPFSVSWCGNKYLEFPAD